MAVRLLTGLVLVVVAGCSSADPVSQGSTGFDSVAVRELVDDHADEFRGVDRWEVSVCRVPDDVEDPLYETAAERLVIDVDTIVERLDGVSEYFSRWSHGRYTIEWVAAADVTLGRTDDSYDCVDRALDASDSSTNGVLVVADAQHAADAPGGWGRRGERCDQPCTASESRRAAYIGASDFVSYWGDDSPLDLIEHEIGHALGWPHSATTAGAGESHVYDSDVELMSNSAAPRDVDDTRRHAPGVLALNQWLVGWLDDREVFLVALDDIHTGDWQDVVRLATSDSAPNVERARLVLIDLGPNLLAIEAIADRGDNDHRRESGVAVHEIVLDDDAPEGRWHVVQSVGTRGELVLGSGGEWTSANGELSVRVGEITIDDGVMTADLRVRRNATTSERVSAGN